MPQSSQKREPAHTVKEGPFYQIDSSWYEKSGKTLASVVARRRCPACLKKALKEKGGKESWEDYMKTIIDHCSKEATYIVPETPALEAAFRTILANRNKPTPFEDIHTEMRRRWGMGNSVKDITPDALRRMLDMDTSYGIRLLAKEEAN